MTMNLHPARHAAGRASSVLSAMIIAASAAAALSADQPAPPDSNPLPEVQVIASKLDRHTLNRVAIQFVESRAGVSPVIHQMGRWRADVCPQVTGLTPAASAFISGHVQEIARSVGAPTRGVGRKCAVNVEIVFTPEPQQLLNHIAEASPMLLGSSRSAGDTTFSRAIQSWYLTGTRSMAGFQPPDPQDQTLYFSLFDPALMGNVANIDPPYGGGFPPSGLSGTHFAKGLKSELLHVLVIVDTGEVAKHSLRSIADYIAMLALTRMSSLDACSELPSIIDLLSSRCGEREKPAALTDADTAYLKALYSSNLEANLNLEKGDMRDRMVKTMVANSVIGH